MAFDPFVGKKLYKLSKLGWGREGQFGQNPKQQQFFLGRPSLRVKFGTCRQNSDKLRQFRDGHWETFRYMDIRIRMGVVVFSLSEWTYSEKYDFFGFCGALIFNPNVLILGHNTISDAKISFLSKKGCFEYKELLEGSCNLLNVDNVDWLLLRQASLPTRQ